MRELLGCTPEELAEAMREMGEKPFRAKQLQKWLVSLAPFEDMNNLSANLREKLRDNYSEGYGSVHTTLTSEDGTRKFLLELSDGALVECVLMHYDHGNTLCISTQVGCAMGCTFCASGIGGKQRNMTAGEMLYEVLCVNKLLGGGRSITNVVLMGTGEPLDNYENVVKFLKLLHDNDVLGVSYRNISLSTCGITPMIRRFTEEGIPLNLCLSLHSAIDQKRLSIMPVQKAFPFVQAVQAMKEYSEKTGRRIIFEYTLINGFNDGAEDLQALKRLCSGINCHINVIPVNDAAGEYSTPNTKLCRVFVGKLENMGISATLRRTLGQDIDGACGQLRSRAIKERG